MAGLASIVLVTLGALAWALGWLGGSGKQGPVAASVTVTQTATELPTSDVGANGATPTPDVATRQTSNALTATTPTAAELRTQAYQSLEDRVLHDRKLDPIRGQWVAQLSSKFEGVVDTSQQPTPFTLVQIQQEIDTIGSNPEYGSLVRVVHQGDWAKSSAGPRPLWVTFADIDAPSREAVVVWCETHFTQRGKSLLNVCYPRQMNPR